MYISNRIFLDSSILVEKAKGTKHELFDYLIENLTLEKCINATVLSEFTYYYLAIQGSSSPQTLKEKQSIPSIIQQNSPLELLETFAYLTDSQDIIVIYLDLMQKYNLLPNDALILATCKIHQILQIASFDTTDFQQACLGENIKLIQAISDLI
jgi:predicted nucleic acid-binding protein